MPEHVAGLDAALAKIEADITATGRRLDEQAAAHIAAYDRITATTADALATSGQSMVLPTPGNTLRPTQYLPLLKEPHNVRI